MLKKDNIPLVVIVQRILPHYRLPFFRLLSRTNPDINIQVYHGDKSADSIHPDGFESHYFPNHSYSFLGYSLVFQPGIMKEVIRKSPDLLILEGTFGVLTNLLLLVFRRVKHLPTIYWTAGWENPAITGRRARLKHWLIGLFLSMCDGAIVYGSSAFEYLVNHGVPASKILTAQNTIDVETIIAGQSAWMKRGKEIRQEFAPNSSYVIVYIGHMAPIKRADVLLRAFHLLRKKREDLALLLVGKGQQMDNLKQYIEVNNIPDVYLTGEVIEGVEAYFAAGDIFVMPGTGGLALNQAMALGLPVIATVADGTQFDLIDQGENGFIVPVDDVDELAEAINKILASQDSRIRMGQRSLKIIQERATLRNMVDQYSIAIKQHCPHSIENLKGL
jgi:glycosyltransferase involved in cell wall biosynthesis